MKYLIKCITLLFLLIGEQPLYSFESPFINCVNNLLGERDVAVVSNFAFDALCKEKLSSDDLAKKWDIAEQVVTLHAQSVYPFDFYTVEPYLQNSQDNRSRIRDCILKHLFSEIFKMRNAKIQDALLRQLLGSYVLNKVQWFKNEMICIEWTKLEELNDQQIPSDLSDAEIFNEKIHAQKALEQHQQRLEFLSTLPAVFDAQKLRWWNLLSSIKNNRSEDIYKLTQEILMHDNLSIKIGLFAPNE